MTTDYPNSQGTAGTQEHVKDELKQDASRLKDSVGSRAKQEAESRKGQAVQVAGSASSALNTVADDLRDNPDVPDWMASALQQASRKIEELASHVEGRSIDQLGEDVAQFARRNPGTFLIAAAATGFAAARILRAGADKKRHDKGGMQGSQGTSGMQGSQNYASGQQAWPADENVMPTTSGDFESAYLINEGGSGIGGASR